MSNRTNAIEFSTYARDKEDFYVNDMTVRGRKNIFNPCPSGIHTRARKYQQVAELPELTSIFP